MDSRLPSGTRISNVTQYRSVTEELSMTTSTVDIPGYVAGRWQIDPLHSEVSFTVRHLMISKVHGRFRTVEGVIVTTADPAASSVTATIDLASVDTGSEQRDEHLRSPDFLDVAS